MALDKRQQMTHCMWQTHDDKQHFSFLDVRSEKLNENIFSKTIQLK